MTTDDCNLVYCIHTYVQLYSQYTGSNCVYHTLHAAISVNVLSTTAGNIDAPTYHTSADTIESASNPAYPTSNLNQVAGDPAYPPPAYPQQPMANSTYPVQPMGAQPFTTVTVANQPKHVSVQHIAAIILH